MKIWFFIGVAFFSLGTGVLAEGREVLNESLYRQVKGPVRKLEKALKKENLFVKSDFNRVKRFIKSNDIGLALKIIRDYEVKGGQDVIKAAKRLRKRLKALVPQSGTPLADEDCPGSGFEQMEFFSTERAFAALRPDGLVITWGADTFGGNSEEVADEISCGVIDIVATQKAFAALKADGSVVTWGNGAFGGDSSPVSSQLENVSKVYATERAFVAVKKDGSLVAWGDRHYGGELAIMRESYRVRAQWEAFPLHSSLLDGSRGKVVKVVSTKFAFAAILASKDDPTQKSVFAWGDELFGGDLAIHSIAGASSSAVRENGEYFTSNVMKDISPLLKTGVADVFSNETAFAALKDDGSVVTWGSRDEGGDAGSQAESLRDNVKKIFSNKNAFAALKENGSVVAWGRRGFGGDASSVSDELQSGVTDIASHETAFAALKKNGSVVSWGFSYSRFGPFADLRGGDLVGVEKIVGSSSAFAALKGDGSVSSWGAITMGYIEVEALQNGATSIVSNDDAFAVLRSDGSVVTWDGRHREGTYPFRTSMRIMMPSIPMKNLRMPCAMSIVSKVGW